ncbi:hypothetical protein BH10BDE1_BH10BDE1_34680 [soil metagenome]
MEKSSTVSAFRLSALLLVAFLGAAPSNARAEGKTQAQQAAQFENRICGVNPNRTLFRNPKYEEVVLFFVNHTPKQQTPLLDFTKSFKTKSARGDEVKKFVGANYSLTRAMDEVALMIGDRYVSRKLNWLGVEKASDELDESHEAELVKTAVEVETVLKKDKVKAGDIKSYLMLQLDPVLYARWKNDQLRKTTKLIALDDLTIRMKSRGYIDGKDAKATTLLQAVPGSGIRTSDMEKIIDSSQVSLFSGVKERTPEFSEAVARIKKPEVKKLVADYRIWIDQGIDSLAERDDAVAKTMLAQKGMGLVLLSANFGPGVSDRLMNACPNQTIKKTK